MIEALIAGQRDPKALADLARTRMRARRKDLIAALDGRFKDQHAEEARIMLSQIDALARDIARLEALAGEQIAEIPRRLGHRCRRHHRPGRRPRRGCRRPACDRAPGRNRRRGKRKALVATARASS